MNSTTPQNATTQRPSIVAQAIFVGLLVIGGAMAYKFFRTAPPAPAPVTTTTAPGQPAPAIRPIVPRPETSEAPAAPAEAIPGAAAKTAPPPSQSAPREPDVDSHQLMSTLTSLDLKGPISAEDAQKWKDSLQQLIRQGSSSVAAIREYLAQNVEVSYAGVAGADQLGSSSLRNSLLNALGQISGPEASAAMLQTLQTSIFPTDIATLATILEQQAPGQYSGDIMTAVRTQLAAAAQDQLGNANVGPLFQLLANAGASGTDVSADLAQYSGKWPYYSAIELANLPNGAGVASLVQMAQNNSSGAQSAAVESLAQMAPQNSQALDSLLAMAKQGQVPDGILAQLAPYLGGRENELGSADLPPGTPTQGLHISNGNQDFSAADFLNSLTPAQINQRLTIIDQLLQTIPSDDTLSQNALQQAKGSLTGRLPK